MSIKTYSELIALPTFEERFRYLKLTGTVGTETFGFLRPINQAFYHSKLWLSFKDRIMVRDCGCDLAVAGHEIYGSIVIHHLNPITYEDIVAGDPCLTDPENAVCTTLATHNAIHYGDDKGAVDTVPVARSPHDTCPWKR